MARVRQSNTSAEIEVRKIAQECGAEFETNVTELPGSPDLANRKELWAIFVHGCFWHAHESCKRATVPKKNREFWVKKFSANKKRDLKKIQRLEQLGYSVLVIWECGLENKKKLKKKILDFLTDQKSIKHNYAFPRQEFRLTSQKSVKRIVYLRNGQKITTQILLNNGISTLDADPRSIFDYAFLRKKRAPKSSHSSQTILGVDLFCSCGGLSLGAKEACRALGKKFMVAAAVDKDPDLLKVFKKNFPKSETYENYVENLIDGNVGDSPTKNEKSFLKKLGKIDLLLAGPPCQGHSHLNIHKRENDSRNDVYRKVARLVEIANPQHVLIENVPAIIHSKSREVQKSIELMCEMKYNVDTDIVNLAEIGVPQNRKRHIVVASASKRLEIKKVVRKYRLRKKHNVKWAIGDIEKETPNGHFATPSQLSETNMMRIKYLNDNDLYELPNHLRPPCHRNGHTYPAVYGRIRYNEPSATITCGFLSPGQGRYVHPTQMRTLTPHEAARLQFFPDYFDFSSVETRESLSQAIGNAVPMKLSYIFCLELLGG